jgi:hypothetical protein
MKADAVQRKTQKNFLDIPSAAYQAGYSPRHFRRIIEEDHIPVVLIGQKYFITVADLETWKSTHGEARLEECFIVTRDLEAWKSTRGEARLTEAIKQLDGWMKQANQSALEPVDDFDDED